MHRRRLRKLAAFLESGYIKPKWFNMGRWAEGGFKEKQCGSAACALGWATTIFRDLNLEGDTPMYRGRVGFAAGEAFFGISFEEAEYLFAPDAYNYKQENKIPAKAAAKHIRKLLAGDMPK